MTELKNALVDLDGTLVDYDGQLAKDMAKIKCNGEPDVKYGFENNPDYIEARKNLITSQRGWWKGLPKLEAGWEVLEVMLEIGYEIDVCTQGPKTKPFAWMEKVEWCQVNMDFARSINITRDKGLFYGRVLFDDYPKYMEAWLAWRTRGLGVMLLNEVNKDFNHPNVIKYDGTNMPKVRNMLRVAFDRRVGENIF